jgi:hypothetical protein
MTTLELSTALARRALSTTAATALFLSAAGAPAMAGNLCVSMSGSGGQVAGFQLDLKWDSGCMSADKGSGDSARCTADPSTGKDVHSSLKAGPGNLRALFFSMSDTNPIGDGDVFCCSFTRSSTSGNACCGLSMGRVSGSDSTGRSIPASDFNLLATMDGQTCAASGGGGGGGQERPPVRSGLQGGGVAPPVVSVPGGAPAAAPQAPAGGQPAAPAGRGAAPEAPAGMDQVQRALEQLAPRQAPTAPAEATAAGEAISTPRPAAGTPSAKPHATQAHGTPTPAAKKTPAAAATPGSKTPGATPEATPKAQH